MGTLLGKEISGQTVRGLDQLSDAMDSEEPLRGFSQGGMIRSISLRSHSSSLRRMIGGDGIGSRKTC